MSAGIEEIKSESPVVKYSPSEAHIATLKEKYSVLSCDTREGYEATRIAIRELVGMRSDVERQRNHLLEESRKYQKSVNGQAKHYTNLILEIEEPLKVKKQVIDDEKERIAREKVEAAKKAEEERIAKEVAEREAKAKAERDAQESRLRSEAKRLAEEVALLAAERKKHEEEQRIERERIAGEQKAERERLAEERRKIEEERCAEAERQRKENARLLKERQEREAAEAKERKRIREEQEAERRKIEEERQAVIRAREAAERAEFERQAKIKAEHEAKEKAERKRIADEESRIAELERKAVEEKRLDAIRPDVERVHTFAEDIEIRVKPIIPACKSKEAKEVVNKAVNDLEKIVSNLKAFVAK